MNVQLIESKPNEVGVSIKEGDLATLYIIQHELLKDKGTDFAGLITKHPLTNEIWMRVIQKITPYHKFQLRLIQQLKLQTNSKTS